MTMIFAKCYLVFSIIICAISILLMAGWSFVGTAEQELAVGVPFLTIYAVTLIATFPVYRVRSQWKAIFDISATKKKVAHFSLWLAIVNFVVFTAVAILVRLISGSISSSLALRFVGSALWLNGVYLVIHWAYRPENVFSRSTLILMNNPLFSLFSPTYRRNAAKAR